MPDGSESTGLYEEGVYTGTGDGYQGDINVTVTVAGGSITDIAVDSYQDDDPYFTNETPL